MADRLLKEYLYGDLLSPSPGFHTDFALGMTYCLSFEALLTAHLAFGMLGDIDENIMQSKSLLLNAITKNSDKIIIFCNKGGIDVPPKIRKVYSLLESNIFEVFDPKDYKANFHPKLWLIREVSNDDTNVRLLKLIVTSRNLAYTDTIDCVVCLTGIVGSKSVKNDKHLPLVNFIKSVVETSNIGEKQQNPVLEIADDLMRVEKFEVETPFEDYDFFPYLFKKDFGLPAVEDYLVGYESIIVSPFIDKTMLSRLNPEKRRPRTLITRKENVDQNVFDQFKDKGGIYVALDDLASRGMDLHAKMYHVWNGRDEQYLYLGSANATSSAFERNGEFLLRLKYKYGNTRASQFLCNFYDKDNKSSKFLPLNYPIANTSQSSKWDVAETAMKELMCAEDLKARILRHRDGTYTTIVTSNVKKLKNEVYIAPLQKKDLMQRWTGRVTFEEMKIDELSEFFILSAASPEGKRHEVVIKIETTGMPEARDSEIFKNIIKTPKDFYQFIELTLTETPLEYFSKELLHQASSTNSKDNDNVSNPPNIFEKMMRLSSTNPQLIKDISKWLNKIDVNIIPPEFRIIYKLCLSAIK